jgi:hypothetical protein
MSAAITEPVKDLVKDEWAIEPDVSAREVARRFQRKYGRKLIRDRKIIQLVTEAKKEAPSEPFPLVPWKPWANEEETPEHTLFLLRINAIKLAEQAEGLYVHEAQWGRRIRPAIEELQPPYRQYRLVMMYARREVVAYYRRKTANTEALDAFIAYQPWLPENQRRYELAILARVAPLPFVPSREDWAFGPSGEPLRDDFLKLLGEFESATTATSFTFLPPGELAQGLLSILDHPDAPKVYRFERKGNPVQAEQRRNLVESWASLDPPLQETPPAETPS